MIEFGKTLRAHREAKGLTTSEVAQKTHILVQQVEALEKEDFSKIAAPIYGRGFVKLYCEAVGIADYKPLVDEFMDIYSGNKPPTIRMKTVASADNGPSIEESSPSPDDFSAFSMSEEIKSEDTEQVAAEPENEENTQSDEISQTPESFDDFLTKPETDETKTETESIKPETEEPPPPPPDNLFDFALATENAQQAKAKTDENATSRVFDFSQEMQTRSASGRTQGPSRYSTPKPLEFEKKKRFDIPPIVWRIGVLAAVAVFILWLIIAGISALYRAAVTTDESADTTETASETQPATSGEKTSSSGSSGRTPMKLQPLYMNFND
ncbi:MAG: helix-turn-helix domain-containing protein [Kiritimatiellae bacterium]|nr:helix-turn-helix domain-containing protein [Kiritimatiellia bacterium]MBR3777568.1 helix-turn-helix domain-containing protein [Kiritimatiellia bacterium]